MFFGRDRLRAKEGVTCIRESNHHRPADRRRTDLFRILNAVVTCLASCLSLLSEPFGYKIKYE